MWGRKKRLHVSYVGIDDCEHPCDMQREIRGFALRSIYILVHTDCIPWVHYISCLHDNVWRTMVYGLGVICISLKMHKFYVIWAADVLILCMCLARGLVNKASSLDGSPWSQYSPGPLWTTLPSDYFTITMDLRLYCEPSLVVIFLVPL